MSVKGKKFTDDSWAIYGLTVTIPARSIFTIGCPRKEKTTSTYEKEFFMTI